jgi:ribosomal protein S18 acetylase RimI-like enzyme
MYLLQKSSQSDLQGITLCHEICFPKSLTVDLGLPYIKKTMEWFLKSEHRFLYHVVAEDNSIVGYAGGLIPQFIGDGSTSGMMKYAMKEAFQGMLRRPSLLFKREVIAFYPLVLKNLVNKFLRTKKEFESKKVEKTEQKLGFVVIGVHPDHRGKGVFDLLMSSLDKEANERNIKFMSLSVRTENKRAINGYKKAGWEVVSGDDIYLVMHKRIKS